MRLMIAAPRKTGNTQLRCLLASLYGLELISSRDAPAGADFTEVASWLQELPDRSVTHTSFRHTAQLESFCAENGIRLVAVLRHPFDLFVSIYEIAQRRSNKTERQRAVAVPWASLSGRKLDDPEVLAYLRDGFSDEIAWLKGWHQSGVPVLRFELMQAAPARALAELGTQLGSLDDEAVLRALTVCPAENLVRSSPVRGRRLPTLSAGIWRERLSDDHIAILQERYGDDVRQLGYELT